MDILKFKSATNGTASPSFSIFIMRNILYFRLLTGTNTFGIWLKLFLINLRSLTELF